MKKFSQFSRSTQTTLRNIRNLPIRIGLYTDLSKTYVKERVGIRTEKQLKAFTKRWISVWKIPWMMGWRMRDEENQIVSGRYSAKKVLRCINKNGPGGSGCVHVRRNRRCLSPDIMAPAFLMKMLEIRQHFGVPDGVALLQSMRALHDDLSNEDPDAFFEYINTRTSSNVR